MSTLKIILQNNSAVTDANVSIGFVSGSDTAAFDITNAADGSTILPLNEVAGNGNWYTLSELSEGVNVSNFSGRVYVSYGQTWSVLDKGYEPPQNITDQNFFLRYDKMELTFNGEAADVADLTSIDYWSIPMTLNTLLNGICIQTDVGLIGNTTTQDVFNALKALTTPPVSNTTSAVPALVPGEFVQNSNQPGSGFARIIGPSSYPATGGTPAIPYDIFDTYLNFLLTTFGPGTTKNSVISGLGDGVIALIAGEFEGVGPNVPPTGPQSKQSYNLSASIDTSNNITLSGIVGGEATTMFFSNSNLEDPSGIYGANAAFSLDGGDDQNPANDVYGWICGDLLAGINIGALGSTVEINKSVVGAMQSSDWFTLPNDELFETLQPQNSANYNNYASTMQPLSEAYNFAYSDRFAPVLVSLNPATVDTLQIILLPATVTMP